MFDIVDKAFLEYKQGLGKRVYDNSKKNNIQWTQLFDFTQESNLSHCVARPTLMFGWFDPKHFGWLSRFMAKVPVFPIPGSGKYMRQPLYVIDFCRVLN